jgi:hypothetical protein
MVGMAGAADETSAEKPGKLPGFFLRRLCRTKKGPP